MPHTVPVNSPPAVFSFLLGTIFLAVALASLGNFSVSLKQDSVSQAPSWFNPGRFHWLPGSHHFPGVVNGQGTRNILLSTQIKPSAIKQHLRGSSQSSIHPQFHIFVKIGVRATSELHVRERSLPSTTIPCSYYSTLSIRTSLRLSVKGLREIHIQ